MVEFIAWPALIVALLALVSVGKPEFLRFVQGTRHVHGQVVRHQSGSDGYVPIFAFRHDGRTMEVSGLVAQPSPKPPVGSSQLLSYPKKRPDLARPPAPLGRTLMYFAFAAWIGFFSDLLFDWW
jgi:hypothetical protein